MGNCCAGNTDQQTEFHPIELDTYQAKTQQEPEVDQPHPWGTQIDHLSSELQQSYDIIQSLGDTVSKLQEELQKLQQKMEEINAQKNTQVDSEATKQLSFDANAHNNLQDQVFTFHDKSQPNQDEKVDIVSILDQ